MAKLIGLSAGHSNQPGRDRGAAGNGYVEGILTVELREMVYSELKKLGITAIKDGNNTILQESINFFKTKINSEAIALEFHWNSSVKSEATGVETIVPANPEAKEILYAQQLSLIVRDTLNIPLRGNRGMRTELETHHGKLGWMRMKCTNLLLEVCFISNAEDMESYQANKEILAKRIAQFLYNCANNVTFKDGSSIRKTITHVVQSGDTLTSIAKKYNTSILEIKKTNHLQGDFLLVGEDLTININ